MSYYDSLSEIQKCTMEVTKKVIEGYLDYQTRLLNSYQSAYLPYFNNQNPQSWTSQDLLSKIPTKYAALVNMYDENINFFGKIFNEAYYSTLSSYKKAINNTIRKTNNLLDIEN